MRRFGTIAMLLLLPAGLGPACGDSGGGGRDAVDPGDVPAVDAPDAGADAPRVPLEITEPFRAVIGCLQRVDPFATTLRLRDPSLPAADGTASLSDALAAADPALDCHLGCRVDATGRWLAVFVAPPSSAAGGSLVRLFRLSAGPTVTASGLPDVTDVRALAFGRDALYWSRPRTACEAERGPSKGCHAFYRRPLPTPGPEEFLFSFPTASALATALPHSGRFVMGQDGQTVLLMAPTVNTQGIWLWREPGEPLQVVGPVCGTLQGGADGSCVGSGVAYSDTDPVALSPDGRHLAFGLVLEDRRLALGHLDLQAGGPFRTVSLLTMPEGSYTANNAACYNRFGGWEPTAIQPPLRFSPDGTEVIFVGKAACGVNRDKAWTNVLALPLSRIDAGGNLSRDDLRWITDFPAEDSARCVTITPDALDLSPTGAFVTFVGTPRYDSQGVEILANQLAHRNDAEVWATRTDGTTEPSQLTAEQAWMATSVAAIPVPAP